jgi:hypothetical protein
MPAGRGDDRCREIRRNGICRIRDFRLEIRKQNIGGSIEHSIGVIEPGTAGIIRARRRVAVIVIAGLDMIDWRPVTCNDLATGPKGEHQRQGHPAGYRHRYRFAVPDQQPIFELDSCHSA